MWDVIYFTETSFACIKLTFHEPNYFGCLCIEEEIARSTDTLTRVHLLMVWLDDQGLVGIGKEDWLNGPTL